MPEGQSMNGAGGQRNVNQVSSETNPSGPEHKDELSPGMYGPWMSVPSLRRKLRGPNVQRGVTNPQTNRFEILRDEGEDKGPLAHSSRDKGKEKAQADGRFRNKARATGKKTESTSFGMTNDKKREETRLGNKGGTDIKIRDQEVAMRESGTSNPLRSKLYTSLTSDQPSSHSNNPSHLSTNSHPRVGSSRPKFRVPPDKHGGGRRELPHGDASAETEQSNGMSNTRERSVSPHHLRMVEQGNKVEDSSMEASGGQPGYALSLNDTTEVDGR
ncbi:hypothetical protein LOK49_LG14G02191 [Camellia lanceoleosa]|uniref:Uncharacterized protein n=1 Tax=Camellia lanceoleosa TaxID=1840588 RepID=A0ACC0FE02_9ERIC|nr:hypothetical protein LOK49_LG14G02191 [Camellia lanceoleosa]